jgi:predicted lipoprotein with Yx(FWY)xxD motif
MRTRSLITSAIALVAAGAAAAMGSSAAVAAPAHPTGAAGAATGTPVVVTTAPSKFGRVLVTGSGESLYVFSGDGLPFSATGPQLACTALNTAPSGTPCTTAWPPLLASGPLVAKGGVHQSGLGTVSRNGVTQVTYDGSPVYGFAGDKAAGQMNGEDVAAFDGTWYLDSTDGRQAVGTPTVTTELSSNGIVLSSPTASGTRTVYSLTADQPFTTTCTGPCAAVWPPLLTAHPRRVVAGTGTDRRLLGTIRRPDGTFQVTYRGRPVYFFSFDLGAGAAAGLTNGEYLIDPAASGNWYTLLPNGTSDPGTTTVGSEADGSASILSITAGFEHTTATLYAFSADSTTASKCTGKCAVAWPPVLTSTPPAATGSASGSLLGSVQRADGTFQVTYNGKPLYFFAGGLDSGTSGAGLSAFGGTFNVVNVNGTVG